MPHIAVVLSGLTGRLHSGFELISRLEAEGHRVTCLCQPYTTEKVANQNFNFLEIPELNLQLSHPELTQPSWLKKWIWHLKNSGSHFEYGKKISKLEAYEKIWDQLKPDHALVDVELHELIFTACKANIPVTLFHTWFSDTPGLRLPPIRSSITPGQGFSGSSLGIAMAWCINQAKIWGRLYINRLYFKDYRRATIRRYAKEIGFPVKEMAVSTLPPLYRFKKLPILLLAMKELDFPHRPAKNLKYVGPMVYENRQDLEAPSDEAKELTGILETNKKSDKKLIYCAVGSMAKGDVPFLKKVIEVVGNEEDWILVLSLGRNLPKDTFPSPPKNVHLFNWVPQLKVIAHADCCINHAGINTINECLHFAVPMVIYSLKYTDENGNASRMAYHGVALVGNKDIDNASQIRENIAGVLNEKGIKKNMKAFNTIYRKYKKQDLSPFLFKKQREELPVYRDTI